jgi:hypothetical protein
MSIISFSKPVYKSIAQKQKKGKGYGWRLEKSPTERKYLTPAIILDDLDQTLQFSGSFAFSQEY